jgi:hypothetical protein
VNWSRVNAKVAGRIIYESVDKKTGKPTVQIFKDVNKPKTLAGKTRITVSLRQLPKRWKLYALNAYPFGFDITLEEV